MIFLPIVQRELQVAARRPATYWTRSIAAAVLVVIFLCCILGNRNRSSADVAQEMFALIGSAALGGCLLAGIFQTSDCLSSEKREGTLGLIFLTDLRGYDVILGKLVSSSLGAVYGLLAIFPLLGLPLLMGGVNFAEFCRASLVLLVAINFSLCVGILASALCRESRQAMGLAFLLIAVPSGVLPAVYGCLKAWNPALRASVDKLLESSLGYAYFLSFDRNFNSRISRHEYWVSIEIALATALTCLVLASLILPRVWHERATRASSKPGFFTRLRFGSPRQRLTTRQRRLLPNPFFWLGVRDRMPRISASLALLLLLPFWFFLVTLQSGGRTDFMVFSMFSLFALSLITKAAVAAEASRRLNDDHHSGALELLLVTPLSVRQILSGQKQALRRHFFVSLFVLALLFMVQFWVVITPVSTTGGVVYRDPELPVIVLGNLLTLPFDYWALTWVGMWCGLRSRQQHRAILGTLLRLLVIPWVFYFILGFSGFLNGSVGARESGLALWFLFGVVNDLFWALCARRGLKKHFRSCAAGVAKQRRRRAPPLIPQTAAL